MRSRIIAIAASVHYLEEAGRFREHLLRLGHGTHGTATKYAHLLEFFHWLEQRGIGRGDMITPRHITEHYSYLQQRPNAINGQPLHIVSLHHHVRAIALYFDQLQAEGRISLHPMGALKFPTPRKDDGAQREVLTQEEVRELYDHAADHRERAMLGLAYGCGMRVGELVAVNLADIKLGERILIVPKGKGNKRRVIPLSSGVIEDLGDYYHGQREALTQGRSYNEPAAFMLNGVGGRMRKGTWNKHLKAMIARTGNAALQAKAISMHNLRHSIATHLIEQGVKVEQVREFLGHSCLESTQVYTHIGRKHLKELKR